MYKYIAKKKANLPQIWKDKIFTLTEINDKSSLVEIDNEFDFKWIGLENNIYSFTILGDLIVYEVDDEYTLARNLKSLEIVYTFDKPITVFIENCDENYYYHNTKKMGFIKFDYLKGEVNKVFLENRYNGLHKLLGDFLVLYKDKTISVHSKNDFSLLWQKNLSDITSYKDYDGSLKQGDIREIYSYNNTLIVLTQVFILRLHIETGEIIYSLRLPAGLMTLSIEGDKAYGCYGYHYMEIDLEKGELINFVRLENALLNGQEYNAIMNKASYKDGFVFHGLRLEGGQYAVGAINT
ncbi:hypothetical protein, partial [Capnocytophaga cynodegmi]|uniref:hypothetical protein n=1 Tax=Capnocytophaga cynodegmi TaxID=28189 RepID=UPI001BB4466F